MTRWRFHRFVKALRKRARCEPDPAAYLLELQVRVIRSGQPMGLIPGHEIIARAAKIEERRARVRNRLVAVFGLRKVEDPS
jgi:hypothetical protein